jgi:glycosyltransferase involved in cell wall biosynthesis
VRILVIGKAFRPSTATIRRADAFVDGLRAAGHQVVRAGRDGDVDVRLPAPSVALVGAARRLRLGRVYRAATRPWMVPDDAILDLAPGLAALASVDADVVVASGPPQALVVLGAAWARLRGRRFVADLRDPWADHPELLHRAEARRAAERALEARVLDGAAQVFVATRSMAERLRARVRTPVDVLLNGYDPERFTDRPAPPSREGAPVVGVYGSFYGPIDPAPLVRATRRAGAVLEHAGQDFDGALARAARAEGLELRALGLLSGADAAQRMIAADVLGLVLPDDPAWGYVRTQKLSEYLASGRPVLAIVPPGEVAAELAALDAGLAFGAHEVPAAAAAIGALAARASRPLGPPHLAWAAQVARLVAAVEGGPVAPDETRP